MPLGDPNGGNFQYTVEGLPENIFAFRIPTKNLERAISFYTEILGMKLQNKTDSFAIVKRNKSVFLLAVSKESGINTGVYIGVENPFDLHRRLIDEGVIFIEDPVRGPLGVYTSFKDDDGNILYAVEDPSLTQ